MEGKTEMIAKVQGRIVSTLDTVKKVIINPVAFFKDMPRSGGFPDPLIFMILIGVAVGIIQAIFAIFWFGFAIAFASIIIVPVFFAMFGFVSGGILFAIWKIMGSQESFETAYRCGAYASAITPVTAIIGIIPYLGGIIGLAWMMYLLVTASIEVHNTQPKKAWIVFGAIFAFFAILTISSQFAAKKTGGHMEQWQQEMNKDIEKMTPEDAGKAAGKFLKGMEKEVDRK